MRVYPLSPPGRNAKIYEMRKSGRKLREIGKEFGISPERVRQVVDREVHHEEWLMRRQQNPELWTT